MQLQLVLFLELFDTFGEQPCLASTVQLPEDKKNMGDTDSI